MKLQQALCHCKEVLFRIKNIEAFVTAGEFGHGLEHVEVLQRKIR
jgi:spectrin alpha